jgi:hypothetical protein
MIEVVMVELTFFSCGNNREKNKKAADAKLIVAKPIFPQKSIR